jgi:hypothetical protein
MAYTKSFAALLAFCLGATGAGSLATGCDTIKGLTGGKEEEKDEESEAEEEEDEEEEDEEEPKKGGEEKKPAESATAPAPAPTPSASASGSAPAPSASASAPPPAEEKATTYPDMKVAEGEYKLLKVMKTYLAADETSKMVVELPVDTVFQMKNTYKEWSLIEFDDPAKAGEKKQAWLKAQPDKDKTIIGPVKEAEPTPKPPTPTPTPTPQPSTQPPAPQPPAPQPPAPQPPEPGKKRKMVVRPR